MATHRLTIIAFPAALALLAACTPTVQVAPPSEPITINLNVKIEHEILVKVDREIDDLLEENSNLF
ncbi:YnbE family lipoprotein [Marinobacterium nitratireducens]|uniref:YnbE family lipoprotein n=1 Tax=Marinobacterium nitratireducens TaxID=518897 RepID=A0A918DUZ6_9GAMM|nr:YnbE family lipoprotein [Marinobacterium nitratireducens]GGO83250.1 YnbE family lipoprotein [Marinobacterium nitratireducens]